MSWEELLTPAASSHWKMVLEQVKAQCSKKQYHGRPCPWGFEIIDQEPSPRGPCARAGSSRRELPAAPGDGVGRGGRHSLPAHSLGWIPGPTVSDCQTLGRGITSHRVSVSSAFRWGFCKGSEGIQRNVRATPGSEHVLGRVSRFCGVEVTGLSRAVPTQTGGTAGAVQTWVGACWGAAPEFCSRVSFQLTAFQST